MSSCIMDTVVLPLRVKLSARKELQTSARFKNELIVYLFVYL